MVSYKDLLLTLGQTRLLYVKNVVVCKGIHSKLHVNKTGALKSVDIQVEKILKNSKN